MYPYIHLYNDLEFRGFTNHLKIEWKKNLSSSSIRVDNNAIPFTFSDEGFLSFIIYFVFIRFTVKTHFRMVDVTGFLLAGYYTTIVLNCLVYR